MYKRILVPLDGSLRAERALPVAARLARAGSGEVILTQVVTAPNYLGREEEQSPTAEAVLSGERETALRALKDVSQRLELAGVSTRMEVREAPSVAPALLDIVGAVHADLVIMCSHGPRDSSAGRWAALRRRSRVTRPFRRSCCVPMGRIS